MRNRRSLAISTFPSATGPREMVLSDSMVFTISAFDNLEAYRMTPETGLLIRSVANDDEECSAPVQSVQTQSQLLF